MPRRTAPTRERLAQLLGLPAAAIAHELSCTPDHANVLLRQHRLACVPAGCGRRAGTRFMPSPSSVLPIQQFQASGLLVSRLDQCRGLPARLFDGLSGRVPMPEKRLAVLFQLFNQNAPT